MPTLGTNKPTFMEALAAELEMQVHTHRDASGNNAIIRTQKRSMVVRLLDTVRPEVSLQLTVSELRDQASDILARADFIERAAHVLLGREKA